MPDFAKTLRTVRKHHRLTQEEAAAAFTISHKTIQRIEAGERDLTWPELERIAEFCQKDIHEILQLDTEHDEEENGSVKPSSFEKEERLEKIIATQNEKISSLLEEMKNLYGVVKKLISGGGEM
jgi:transcriptional regulator with XRE-family HTH domain